MTLWKRMKMAYYEHQFVRMIKQVEAIKKKILRLRFEEATGRKPREEDLEHAIHQYNQNQAKAFIKDADIVRDTFVN